MTLAFEDFIWLDWVVEKIVQKHAVDPAEVEEAFTNVPYKVRSASENKYILYGRSYSGRFLFIVFVWVERCIKVITARDMTRGERQLYERK